MHKCVHVSVKHMEVLMRTVYYKNKAGDGLFMGFVKNNKI